MIEAGQVAVGNCLKLLPQCQRADLVIGSPPYAGKGGRYGKGSKPWPTDEWVPWMIEATEAALPLARNCVVWVVNGRVKDGRYEPACEGLVWEAYKRGIICERPAVWHKNAPPNRRDWFGNDWEFVLAFRPCDSTRYFDWESIGTPYKYTAGGRFRQRDANGKRRLGNAYPKGKLARPRDVIRATVGGGHMGHKAAHDNEAPFPESLIAPLIKALVPPGGLVIDPFCGSGTVPAVAEKLGRQWIGIETRAGQAKAALQRVAEVRQHLQAKG